MTDGVLASSKDGPVLTVVIDRPTKANALSTELIEALDRLADDIERDWSADRACRALVLTGAGTKAFSAGADVTQIAELTGDSAYAHMRRGQRVFDRLERLPVPVIAAVNGHALGGGLELAMAADLRVASPHARLGQPEISLANLPGWGGTQRLPQLVGVGRAKQLILTGELIDAATALSYGLVNAVSEDCLAVAQEWAHGLAQRSAVALDGAKRAIWTGLRDGTEVGLEEEARLVARCCETPEQKAATAAFLRRRA